MGTANAHVTAFVMAGGGSLGAIEVGMLRELLAWGEMPSFVVGASAGAINGAYFAATPTLAGVAQLESIWVNLTRQDLFPFNLGSVLGLLTKRAHLVDSHGLRRLLERHLPYEQLQDAALPIHIVASDMVTGEEVLISTGSAVNAVLASAAIPGVFPPVLVNGQLLVDGGIANNTPISTALRLGATRIIVLPTGFACALKKVPSGAVGRAMHALSLVVARQLVHDAQRLAAVVDLRIVPSLCPLECSPYDYSAAKVLIERSAATTRHWLKQGGLDREGAPMQIHPHSH
jgi:NTE family protein